MNREKLNIFKFSTFTKKSLKAFFSSVSVVVVTKFIFQFNSLSFLHVKLIPFFNIFIFFYSPFSATNRERIFSESFFNSKTQKNFKEEIDLESHEFIFQHKPSVFFILLPTISQSLCTERRKEKNCSQWL